MARTFLLEPFNNKFTILFHFVIFVQVSFLHKTFNRVELFPAKERREGCGRVGRRERERETEKERERVREGKRS
jgi:hypothetical protein